MNFVIWVIIFAFIAAIVFGSGAWVNNLTFVLLGVVIGAFR